MSVSILSNTALNFGFDACILLLLLLSMLSASMSMSVSSALNVSGLFAMC